MIPLSYAQQRLWFLDQMERSGAHNAPLALRLSGDLDVTALAAAFGDLADRHETLRTVFPTVDGQPHQLVLPMGTHPKLEIVEWTGETLVADLNEVAFQPFDLEHDPQIRPALFVLAGSTPDAYEYVLLIVLHHIASDGWSLGPLLGDLGRAYAARRDQQPPDWEPLPVQYADYTLWQRELLGDESDPDSVISRQLRYWARALDGAPDEMALPTDRSRPARRTYEAGLVPFTLDAALHTGLVRIATERGATLFMVLQAAVAALLTRVGAGEDIVTGTPIAGRTDEALDPLVGFFVNTLVLRADTGGDPTFSELIDRVRVADLAAYAHQDVPFERVVEVLNPPRSLIRHPIFQVSVVLQNNSEADPRFLGMAMRSQALTSDTARFDLTVAFAGTTGADRAPGNLHVNLEFAAEIFDHETIATLGEQLERMLSVMVSDPGTRIGDVDILGPDLRHTILREWNDTEHEVPYTTLTALTEAGRDAHPDAPAVRFGDTALSHAELHARANRVARQLVARGVQPRSRVGVACARSEHLVVALLAVLKAGAAYVPLDTGYPPERLAFMVEDAAPVLVLTDTATAFPGAVVIDGDIGDRTNEDRTDLGIAMTPEDPAYVIYTSGSTGRPKGVVVTHQAIVNRLRWMQAQYPIGIDDRVLQKTPSSFDVSVWEFFWPMIAGATLVVAAPDGHKDPSYLVEVIRREAITTVHFVPSMLNAFLSSPNAASCTSLRCVFASGEALPTATAARFHRLLPASLHNLYGPTEAAVDVTYWPTTDGNDPVPIGRPVWNTRVYVLDAAMRPVPPGVPGELYLAGIQLAAGYLGRPSLTAQRFVADPFEQGTRAYRTGDIARWRRDGVLEYLGRADQQVKLRGQRIEPAEIEAGLLADPAIASACVIVREDHPGDQRLVAYLVGTDRIDESLLSARLARHLPDCMVPSAYVRMDALPLSPSGKLDRRALPAPIAPAGSGESGAPGTDDERLLCGLFAEVLRVPSVGVDDDFFALGGHSLLAVRLVTRLAAETGIEIGVRTVFDRPTVARLAAYGDKDDYPVDGVTAQELRTDATLPVGLRIGTSSRPGSWRNVFLTGATGFLGAFLVRELLDRTDATIFCLVRADDTDAATLRLHRRLAAYGLLDERVPARVVAVAGDLAHREFQLVPEECADLAAMTDAIIHNGARVNHLDPYARLRTTNVAGTREVLRLAMSAGTPVHFISSISASVNRHGGQSVVDESTRITADQVVDSGYVASKWVGEQLVRAAGAAGLSVTVHRPARISAHSRSGACGTDDSFWNYVRAMTHLGAVTGDTSATVDLVPVDHVAAAVVALAADPSTIGGTYHHVGTQSVRVADIVEGLRAFGYDLDHVTETAWSSRLAASVARAAADGDRSWAAAAALSGGFHSSGSGPRWDGAVTETLLRDRGVPAADIGPAEIAAAIGYLHDAGFLAPSAATIQKGLRP